MNYGKKSLEDLYNGIAGKPVQPRKHLSVLGEAKVTVEYDGGDIDSIDNLDDKVVTRVTDYLRDKAEGAFMLKEDYIIVQKLAEKSGFASEDRFLKILFQQFNNVDYNGLETLISKKDSLNVLGSQMSGVTGSLDLYEICKPQLAMFLPNADDHGQFYNMLFARDFKEGNVSVGAGELALSILTEAKKGAVGDLEIGGTQVELKVGQGRVISARSGGFVNDRNKINEIATHGGLLKESGDDQQSIYTLDNIDNSTWNSKFAKEALSTKSLERVISKTDDINMRKQYIGALLLYAYGGGASEDPESHGFDIWLGIFQHGKNKSKSKPARLQRQIKSGEVDDDGNELSARPGFWRDGNYINVKNLSTIEKAVESNLIIFKFDGDGVYGFYPGSSSTASGPGQADFKLFN